MFFDLLLWQENHNAISVKKTAIIFFISTGIFASEPMTLPEIDHVSFLVEHAQTFFAGESPTIKIQTVNQFVILSFGVDGFKLAKFH